MLNEPDARLVKTVIGMLEKARVNICDAISDLHGLKAENSITNLAAVAKRILMPGGG